MQQARGRAIGIAVAGMLLAAGCGKTSSADPATAREVRRLVATLRGGSVAERAEAARSLGAMGALDATGPLVEALADVRLPIRLAAADALGALRDPAAVAPLLAVAAGEEPNVQFRAATIDALGQIGDAHAAGPLAGVLGDPDPAVRIAAVAALGRLGAAGVQAAAGRLADADPAVAAGAAEALGRTGDAGAAPSLVRLLQHDDPRVRRASATALGALRADAATGALVAALRKAGGGGRRAAGTPESRAAEADAIRAAAHALAAIPGDAALDGLVSLLGADAAEVRDLVRGALVGLGAPAVPALLRCAQDAAQPAAVRSRAVEVAAASADAGAVRPLAALLADPALRGAVAEAMARNPEAADVSALLAALQQDGGPEGREAVVRALGATGDRRAAGPIAALVAGSTGGLRAAAIDALGRLGDPAAAEALRPLLRGADGPEGEGGKFRVALIRALGRLKDRAAVPDLIAGLASPVRDVARASADALGDIGDPAAVDALIGSVERGPWGVRHSAAGALAQIGDPRGVGPIVRAMAIPENHLRQAGCEALGRFGHVAAVDALVRMLADGDDDLRRMAALAMLAQGERAVPPLAGAIRVAPDDQRGALAQILGRIGAAALPELEKLAADGDVELRKAAIAALSEVSSEESLVLIARGLEDSDPGVRAGAAWAVGKLGLPGGRKLLETDTGEQDSAVQKARAAALERLSGPTRTDSVP